jgi:hypothetical protein
MFRSGYVLLISAVLACVGQGDALVSAPARVMHLSRVARRTVGSTRSLVRASTEPKLEPKVTPMTGDLNDVELAEQITALDGIAKELRKEAAAKAYDEAQLFGWCAQAETINGRFSMFFFVVGLLTEQFTGESVPQQIVTMLEVVGILPPS